MPLPEPRPHEQEHLPPPPWLLSLFGDQEICENPRRQNLWFVTQSATPAVNCSFILQANVPQQLLWVVTDSLWSVPPFTGASASHRAVAKSAASCWPVGSSVTAAGLYLFRRDMQVQTGFLIFFLFILNTNRRHDGPKHRTE